MHDIEKRDHEPHQRRIEDVNPQLLLKKIPVLALDVFDGSEDGADHDQDAGQVQDYEVLAPGDVKHSNTLSWICGQASVEDQRNDHEAAK